MADGALGELKGPVAAACRHRGEWPAKVAAAIYAVVDFVVANPAGARAVASLAPGGIDDGGRAYGQTVDYFTGLLEATVPETALFPASTRGSIAGIATIVADHVRAGRVDRLEHIGPELVQFALLPYLGFTEARRWAERLEGSGT